ncbi:DnaJ domain-containing protein [Colletotrichum scovillei]|uniref:DnaJ domain-containing protein n=1 Tax=Colletotrichum scovillei TaxID=1209932 RepID=A0A9P7R6F2_9PEZI|nr:DnaJ domain-containing protein [Colletotrichum scovillei]KAF4774177.1 DnaJ domain-containing protein [Colletotrichum scovillei]KAG7048604.1 DnaJ domain-containing protein [Colletotrichum scovillei]KAG7065764.1 DnaJ domain-containing protein [Colletotrichum scovillei]KAG7068370.1 DnaJ domain-containing protein [Colletotrichum scovillei]
MGGVDMSRDYYADLELPADADTNEIKKQFRKLALKYHPDRNPGREAEVNSRFQVIQSAHEILTDPQQRAKYDAGRTRSRYPTASGVRGNPWQNAGANFPPPPRRNATARNPPPPPPASGASRYRNFASGAAPTAKAQTRDDPEAKRNAWHAFENMKGRASQSQPKPAKAPETPKRPVPRTPSQKQRAEASFGRKPGYTPHSPVPADEPPVNSSNYSTSSRHTNIFADNARRQQEAGVPDPLAQFRDSDSRQSTPYMSHGGEKLNPFDGISVGRAKSTRESPRPPQDSYGPNLSPGSARQRAQSVPRQARTEPSSPRTSTSTPQEDRPNTAAATASNSPKDPFRSRASARYTPPNTATGPGPNNAQAKTTPSQNPNGAGNIHTAQGSSIFNFPIDDDTFARTAAPEQPTFSRRSTEEIDTSFVNGDGPDAWKFSAGSPIQDQAAKVRSQSGSRVGRRSPIKRPSLRHQKDMSGQPAGSPSAEGKFDAQDWTQQIGAQNFVPHKTHSTSTSPTRISRVNSRKTKVKPTAGGNAGLVNDDYDSDEETEWRGRKSMAEPIGANSPNAMDIDPPQTGTSQKRDHSNSARNIPVEPSRPEWRPGNGLQENGPKLPARKPEFNPNNAGSEDSEEFRASLADLKNVAPFAQNSSGLGSLNDLKMSLPFESQPSGRAPIDKEKKASLDFPVIPQAPRPPPTFAVNLKPTGGAWQKYTQDFQSYVLRWEIFNAQVIEHFNARKANIADLRARKGYSFLVSRGDDEIHEYLEWMAQDKEVRRKWAVACEDHEARIREFMVYKGKMA